MMAEGEYDAILLDTSIYRNYKYKFESGVLKALSQFKESDVDFLMTDIIFREALSHLNESIDKAKSQLESSLLDAIEHLFFDGSELNSHRENLLNKELLDTLAKNRIDKFIERCGISVLKTEEYASIKDLFDMYFCFTAPFEEKKAKKNEFPDAAVLLTAEGWAKENNKYILAVSRDGGWKSFCDKSAHIDYTEELPQALACFQKDTAPYALRDLIREDLTDPSESVFLERIIDSAINYHGQFSIDADADSHLQFETDESYADIATIEVDGDVEIIDNSDGLVTFSISVNVTYNVYGSFSFYQFDSIDRDYINMGGNTSEIEVTEPAVLVFDLACDALEQINLTTIEIAECEVDGVLTHVDFGSVEPYHDPLDYYD